MNVLGFSSNLYGWQEQYWAAGKEVSLHEIFAKCVEAGLDAIEVDPTEEVMALANEFGLKISGGYMGLPFHEPNINIDETVMPMARRLAAVGAKELIINADPKGGWGDDSQPKTEEEFKRQGAYFSEIAAKVKALGLRVSMHNHAAEPHNADGDLRSVFEYATPDVGLCLDTGWAHVAGQDCVELIKTYRDRIYSLHLRNQQGPVPTEEISLGEIKMAEVVEALKDIHYEGWFTFELLHTAEVSAKQTLTAATASSIDFLKKEVK